MSQAVGARMYRRHLRRAYLICEDRLRDGQARTRVRPTADGWARWRERHHLQPFVPDDFATVLDAVCTLADPVLGQSVDNRIWHADSRAWERQAR